MNYPNFKEEKRLLKRGYKVVVGIDEVGRGPLAGPVVACAFCLKRTKIRPQDLLTRIKDSKKLTQKQRNEVFYLLKKTPGAEWGIGRVSEKAIDKINIFQASKLAMKRAVLNLEKKLNNQAEFLLIDGNFGLDLNMPQKSIVKGDEKVLSIAAASIIAKVIRDRSMVNYCKKYPEYCFDKHKGYPTKLHKRLIKKHGACKLHRQTFHLG